MEKQTSDTVRDTVRKHYVKVTEKKEQVPGCGSTCCGDQPGTFPIEKIGQVIGYSKEDLASAPEGANLGLGCGNPHLLASLKPGEIVLDLGSGGGFDCFIAAKKVGETGRVIGVDMTPEMITKARRNAATVQAENVDFRLAEIERLPVEKDSIDVVISNCVINLSPEKPAVFSEIFRVLKPGGRLAISDIVATTPLPPDVRSDPLLLCGCIGGAAAVEELDAILRKTGFTDIAIQTREESRQIIQEWFPDHKIAPYVAAATITATKPSTYKEESMKTDLKGLDPETQILISLGAAVACGCQPCLEKIVAQARTAGIGEAKLKSAAIIGQFVKDQPAAHMKQLADQLLGTHLAAGRQDVGCPMDTAKEASGSTDKPAALHSGCSCPG